MRITRIAACITFLIILGQILVAQETIQIIVGQQRRVAVPSNAQINIGDPTIATARAMPGQRAIIITGQSKGATSLTIDAPSGIREKIIEVLQRDPTSVVKEIDKAFGSIEGVKFEIVGSMILAKGSIYTLADKAKLETILSIYREILNLTEDLTEKRMISIAISILEVSRTNRTDFNNNELPNGYANVGPAERGDEGVPAGNPLKHIQQWTWGFEVNKLLDRIAYWVTTGKGKIVANPTIAVTDGDEATFMSGGEIPFEYSTRDGLAIEWKEYGIIIKIKPTILGTGNVMLDLESEISSIDRSYQSSTGLPAIASRKANSVSIVNMGETVALAGIYQTTQTRNIRRVPILGHLLPFLFASINNITETKEIIVLVTPKAPPEIKKSDYPMIQKSK